MTDVPVKVHEQLASLVAERTGTLFGLVGDANLFFVHSFRGGGGRYVPALHEASAVMMALGHAHASGEVGFATVTHGPGLTNVVTALLEAVKSHTPLVLVVGDTASTSDYHPQDVEQRPLVAATGSGFVQVRGPGTVAADFGEAYRLARSGSGPVVLNVPIDLCWAEATLGAPYRLGPVGLAGTAPDPDQLDRALGVVATAQRPVLLAGRGALGARAELVALAQLLGAPLATTLLAKDLFRGEPADLGVFGTLATPVAQDVIAAADCILAFGAGLNPYTSDQGHLVDGKALVQVDVAPGSIDRYTHPGTVVIGDAGRTADAMVRLLREADHAPRSFASGPALDGVRAWPQPVDRGTEEAVDMQVALLHLERVLPQERTLVVDVGRFALHAIRIMHAPDARSWLGSGAGFSAIGLGVGAAIGAGLARPDRPAVLVIGDGGFLLGGLSEFRTAVEQQVDLICVVCNDAAYGAEHVQLVNRDLDTGLSLLTPPDLVAVAEALGGRGVSVRNRSELDELASVVETRERPLLIDLRCDPDRVSTVD